MSKRINIGLCAAVLACVTSLTDCGTEWTPLREQSAGASDGTESPKEAVVEAGVAAGEISEKLAEQAVPRYPKIAELPERWIDLVMYTEGCYCIFDGSFYGFMTEDGEEITPYIYNQAAPFSEGLACVSIDGKYGYIGKDGETVIPFIYDQASSFTDGLAYYRTGKEYGFIDHEGRVVLQPDCDSISSFHEGRAYFSVDGLYGYMDKDGKILVEPIYEDAGFFFDGLAKVVQNGCYGMVGMDGEEVLSPEYDEISVQQGYIIAQKDMLAYCFDREGSQCLKEGWDRIEVQEGLIVAGRDGRFGLFDRDGTVLLEPEYDYIEPIPERELVMARRGELYGVVDYEGNERVSFSYHWISYDESDTGGLRTACDRIREEGQEIAHDRSYGCLNFTEEGDFVEIPPIYDSMTPFVGDRAVVGIDGKYGVIRRDGEMEFPMEYGQAMLFQNGSMALRTGKVMKLYDGDGEVIYSGTNVQIHEFGRGYEVTKDGKYGILNEQGEQVLAPVYDTASYNFVCGANTILNMKQYAQSGQNLLVMAEEDGSSQPEIFHREALLQNHITPRAEAYMDFLLNDVVGAERTLSMIELRACRNFSKLYRMGEKGELVLYVYSTPYEHYTFPLSDSGFFVFRNGEMETLMSGYECGGSMRGDYICFWYDEKESQVRLGMCGAWGGFGGYSYGGTVYDLLDEGADMSVSWHRISQTAGNYSMEELQENAELFYDNGDRPYTKESITEAESVTEYAVDGKRTTAEHYEETRSRYRYMEALDQHFYFPGQ